MLSLKTELLIVRFEFMVVILPSFVKNEWVTSLLSMNNLLEVDFIKVHMPYLNFEPSNSIFSQFIMQLVI